MTSTEQEIEDLESLLLAAQDENISENIVDPKPVSSITLEESIQSNSKNGFSELLNSSLQKEQEIKDLESLLLAAEDENMSENIVDPKPLSSITFEEAIQPKNGFSELLNASLQKELSKSSLLHAGDTDSSDDEELMNCMEEKYNDYGKGIQGMLRNNETDMTDKKISVDVDNFKPAEIKSQIRGSSSFNQKANGTNISKPAVVNVYVDPIFGMRLMNPLVSSTALIERMNGRTAISIPSLQKFIEVGDLSKDWVVAGAIVSKTPVKTSQKGNQYCIWTLSDLKGDIKSISLFLFKNAYKDLWKTAEGTVVAILNPSIFDKKGGRNYEASLSVDNVQKIMILGISKDLGTCKSKKKNGEKCSSLVNLSLCEYCVYHVKQEYSKASKRSEFQSATSGRGLQGLKNKVLGKSEVFYGGQMYTAVRATKNPKLIAKDQTRMLKLSEYYQSPFSGGSNEIVRKPVTTKQKDFQGSAAKVDISVKQRQLDIDRLKSLKSDSDLLEKKVEEEKPKPNYNTTRIPFTNKSIVLPTSSTVPEQFKNRDFSFSATPPTLKSENFTLNFNETLKKSSIAKSKAVDILKKKPILKSNPNLIKHRGTEIGKKRALDELESKDNNIMNKKRKIELTLEEKARKERIQRIMDTKSSHTDLIEQFENDEQEKYFHKLEQKEAMEEKMANTFKVACKAVICNICKYMAFSASDKCKTDRHSLKVIDAEKRFFKCLDCGNRTATLYRMPKLSCNQCKSSRWDRTAMIKDRNVLVRDPLSIRGDEETYIGSGTKANINLLVPTD